MPYCQTFTAPGLSPAFGCAGTSLPRTHSLMPVAEYYSALVTTPSTSGTNTCTNTGPATTPTTTTNYPSYFSTKHHRRSSASEVAAFALGVAFALLGSVVCLGIFLARQPGYYILAPPTGSHEYCSKQTNRSWIWSAIQDPIKDSKISWASKYSFTTVGSSSLFRPYSRPP